MPAIIEITNSHLDPKNDKVVWRKCLLNAELIETIEEYKWGNVTVCAITLHTSSQRKSIAPPSYMHKGTMRELQLRIGIATLGEAFTVPVDMEAISAEWSQKKQRKSR